MSSVTDARRQRRMSADAYKAGRSGVPYRQVDGSEVDDRTDEWLRSAWEEGRRQHRTDKRQKATKAAAGSAKKTAKATRRAARQLRDPFTESIVTGGQAMVLTLAVVALYVALANADRVSGFLGFATKAVSWLGDPETSIKYHPNYERPGG